MYFTAQAGLFLAATVAFTLATFNVGVPRVHLGWLGAALATLAILVDTSG